jgi:Ser/Thr protein kinase RdoA (MazF antagonist)
VEITGPPVSFMTAICSLPAFSIDQAFVIVRDLFGIEGTLHALNGECDLNYLLTTNRGRFVFKIANRSETFAMLECQHQVLERLVAHKVMPQQVSSIKSISQKVIETVTSDDGIDHFCRLLPYIEGKLLSAVNPHTPDLLFDLGRTLAKLDQSLQSFTHATLHRPLLWNMGNVLDTLKRFKPLLASDEKRALIEHFEVEFHDTVLPLHEGLRKGVIHNDANDNNVLVSGDIPRQHRVSSIIDFGDMVYSWLAVEPAVAAAYAMLDKDKPLDAAVAIIMGYHGQLALTENEIKVLFNFICMRLCMSVCICAYQQSIEPDNVYLSISEQPAWDLLHKLKSIPHVIAHHRFRDACSSVTDTN